MNIQDSLPLLGGISPASFMKRYWHKKPLLVRAAVPGLVPLVSPAQLFALAGQDHVESRLIQRIGGRWVVRQGPLPRKALPPLAQSDWTLLVQGMDLHHQAVHDLLNGFRFVPDARLDDLMISYASDGGGVGPHFDSYDVFLLQAHGQRRWRIGRTRNTKLVAGIPLKVLAEFLPEEEMVLEPGDMLYLPPGWAHDGIAQGECMTYSIGFRAPERSAFARELLVRLADEPDENFEDTDEGNDEESSTLTRQILYRDPRQAATAFPAEIPASLTQFARQALERALAEPLALERALGGSLTEPKAQVWFDAGKVPDAAEIRRGVRLDRRTRMLYDARHVFINGESYRASGRDAALMHRLADQRGLEALELKRSSDAAVDLLQSWCASGWMSCQASRPEETRIDTPRRA